MIPKEKADRSLNALSADYEFFQGQPFRQWRMVLFAPSERPVAYQFPSEPAEGPLATVCILARHFLLSHKSSLIRASVAPW